MGGRQSNLTFYLGRRTGSFKLDGHYTVKISKLYSKKYSNFVKFKYEIIYDDPPKDTSNKRYSFYSVTIYTGTGSSDLGDEVFYYNCGCVNDILTKVVVYCSVLRPDDPLVFLFVTRKKKRFTHTYEELKSLKSVYSCYIKFDSCRKRCENHLTSEFKKVSSGYKLKLSSASKKTTYNNVYRFLDDLRKFAEDILTPSIADAAISSTDLFTRKPRGLHKNIIDQYYLDIITKSYDGIIVFYSNDDVALALEFLCDVKEKLHLVRKDKYGTYWEKQDISYTDDTKLTEQLSSFQSSSSNNDIVTYILDLQRNYNDVTVQQDSANKIYYNYYTHKNVKGYTSVKSKLLLEKQEFKPEKKEYTQPMNNIIVYYLNHKTAGADKNPFLIKFSEENAKHPKCFFFKKEFKANDCQKFKHGKSELEERLEELEQDGNCTKSIEELRELAFNILKKDIAKPPPSPGVHPPAPGVHPPAPGVHPQPPGSPPSSPAPEPTDIPLIAGSTAGAVGGTAILGAGGYGYYLYATTIKLLT